MFLVLYINGEEKMAPANYLIRERQSRKQSRRHFIVRSKNLIENSLNYLRRFFAS